jgi:flagella basal body P-ring formation protein FlgA
VNTPSDTHSARAARLIAVATLAITFGVAAEAQQTQMQMQGQQTLMPMQGQAQLQAPMPTIDLGALGGSGAAPPAAAAADMNISDALAEQVKQLALASTGGSEVEMPGVPRVEIVVGKLDPRLRLAPCNRIEPNMPAGTKLWGKTRIGLRCVDGPTRWNVYLPLTVKVFGHALVAANPLTPGTPLNVSDFSDEEVDLAAEPGTPMTDGQAIAGRSLFGPMAPGQILRQTMLKPRKFFDAGDMVTITASGEGFSASAQAQAISNGVEGIPARVKMDSGKILSGAPIADHRMDVRL